MDRLVAATASTFTPYASDATALVCFETYTQLASLAAQGLLQDVTADTLQSLLSLSDNFVTPTVARRRLRARAGVRGAGEGRGGGSSGDSGYSTRMFSTNHDSAPDFSIDPDTVSAAIVNITQGIAYAMVEGQGDTALTSAGLSVSITAAEIAYGSAQASEVELVEGEGCDSGSGYVSLSVLNWGKIPFVGGEVLGTSQLQFESEVQDVGRRRYYRRLREGGGGGGEGGGGGGGVGGSSIDRDSGSDRRLSSSSTIPTSQPSSMPSSQPSLQPSSQPSSVPSGQPSSNNDNYRVLSSTLNATYFVSFAFNQPQNLSYDLFGDRASLNNLTFPACT
ncbi:hypothetical protein B484DRAFT_396237, partial [Ochromonadaceae sp. CCMP2298]